MQRSMNLHLAATQPRRGFSLNRARAVVRRWVLSLMPAAGEPSSPPGLGTETGEDSPPGFSSGRAGVRVEGDAAGAAVRDPPQTPVPASAPPSGIRQRRHLPGLAAERCRQRCNYGLRLNEKLAAWRRRGAGGEE